MRDFRASLLICVCASFPFGFEGGVWDLIIHVLVPDHGLPCYYPAAHSKNGNDNNNNTENKNAKTILLL